MFSRLARPILEDHLSCSPAVGILGARQVGKTTLAKACANDTATSVYLDLDSPQALAKLGDPSTLFEANRKHLVVLEEIQNQPDLLSVLRGEIDCARQRFAAQLAGNS
jgi:uncharacterized protein